jgi:hypothetical protein
MNDLGQRPASSRSGAHTAAPRQAGAVLELGRTGANAAGFARVERLDGNVGYLELERFAPVDEAHRTAGSIMELLTGSDALVIDLRCNRGGDPRTAALVTSYLFDTAPLERDEIYAPPTRGPAGAEAPSAPVRRYVRQELRLLLGPRTSALARDFARNLQGLRGATIVEEAA